MVARELLRRRYRPARVRVLFVGESPPASGRFFYQADSGLYRSVRDAFVDACPDVLTDDFLESFCALGCYLVDLCGAPVDKLSRSERKEACRNGESRLSKTLCQLHPEILITVVRSITANVNRAQRDAGWVGLRIELPYPGRWHRHRLVFFRELTTSLRNIFTPNAG